MLAYNKEGKLCLEDADGSVELDFSTLASDAIPFLTTCMLRDSRMSLAMAFLQKAVLPLSKENIPKKQNWK